MSRSDRSAALCAAAAILCLGLQIWGRSPPLALTAAAAPLVFYLPGWGVLRALGVEPEGWPEANALRVALSLAIVVIVGLLLHLADSITRPGWLIGLGAVTLTGCRLALARQRRSVAAAPTSAGRGGARRTLLRPGDIATMAGAIGVAAAAVAVSVAQTSRHHEFRYTQLWIVPKEGAPDEVVVGLRNKEAGEERYEIELFVDRRLVRTWGSVPLRPGETWTTTFRWVGFAEYPRPDQHLGKWAPAQEASMDVPRVTISQRVSGGASPRVEALVYRSNNRSVIYRQVWTAPQCFMRGDARGRPPCEF
jgi:hypothetical protein